MEFKKFSDVNPFKALRLSDEDRTKYVFKEKRIDIEDNKKYDFALLLGCSDFDILKSRTTQIGELYQNGVVDRIITTGGVGHNSKHKDVTEASVMKGILLDMGVSESDVLLEDKSKDTIGNMKNSLKLIRKECGLSGDIIIGSSHFHISRAEGLLIKTKEKLEKELNENIPINIATYGTNDGKHDIDNWFLAENRDGYIPQEAFWKALYVMFGKIPDMPIESNDGYSNTRK